MSAHGRGCVKTGHSTCIVGQTATEDCASTLGALLDPLGEIEQLLAAAPSFRPPVDQLRQKKAPAVPSYLHRVQHSLNSQDPHRTFEVVCQDVEAHLSAYARESLC
jgi:hypothetical protein